MYADCDEASVAAALARLRPQSAANYTVPYPLTAFPDVPCTSIVCTEDRLVGPDWSRRVARERIGADLVELPGSHSPFWSRPRELARVLDALA
jgi:pimeloyl-ACP methyl ester carboxylesterase